MGRKATHSTLDVSMCVQSQHTSTLAALVRQVGSEMKAIVKHEKDIMLQFVFCLTSSFQMDFKQVKLKASTLAS